MLSQDKPIRSIDTENIRIVFTFQVSDPVKDRENASKIALAYINDKRLRLVGGPWVDAQTRLFDDNYDLRVAVKVGL